MSSAFDARDYGRGAKRAAKDFRRALRSLLAIDQLDETAEFRNRFRVDVSAVIRHLSHGYEAVNSVGLHRASDNPRHVEQAFFLLHEALNLMFVALRTLRGGSILASDGILRQALELVSVGYRIASDTSGETLDQFLRGELPGPKAITVAKRLYDPIGRLYGKLSNSAVHASLEHVRHSISVSASDGELGRIRIGAFFDSGHASDFKLGLIRLEQTAVAVVALAEAALIDFIATPRLWKRTASGLEWAHHAETDMRLDQAERERKAIEEPTLVVYPWADPADRTEVQRLLGTTEGVALRDVDNLRRIAGAQPQSFIARYLLGCALQDVRDYPGATSEFEAAWTLRPDGYDVWSRLEGIYKLRSDDRPLEDFYRRSLERQPGNYVAVHNLGMLHTRRGQHEDALSCFSRARELEPTRFMAALNVGNALLRLGQNQRAIDAYRIAAACNPEHPEPWHDAGVAHVRANDLQGAYKAFRRAVHLDPGYFASWVNLVGVCRELGLLKRAFACATRAQQLAPGDHRAAALVQECQDLLRR